MGLSIRGLTRGVMGGITAYRRGALAGNEQNREIAAAEAARVRQSKQDELAAMYQQLEANLASRRQAAQESQFKEEAPTREAQTKYLLAGSALRDVQKNRGGFAPRAPGRGTGLAGMTDAALTAWRGQLMRDTVWSPRGTEANPNRPQIQAIDAELRRRAGMPQGQPTADPWANAFDVQD